MEEKQTIGNVVTLSPRDGDTLVKVDNLRKHYRAICMKYLNDVPKQHREAESPEAETWLKRLRDSLLPQLYDQVSDEIRGLSDEMHSAYDVYRLAATLFLAERKKDKKEMPVEMCFIRDLIDSPAIFKEATDEYEKNKNPEKR